jgi:phosphoglucomutase
MEIARCGEAAIMDVSPLAGKPADPSILIDASKLLAAYYTGRPDSSVRAERVAFGTSGHRGCSLDNRQGIDGPLYIGIDTHASA